MNEVMTLLALLLGLLAVTSTAQKPSTAGFISIDCGLDGNSTYTDNTNGLVYSSDEPYTSTGVNQKVSPETNVSSLHPVYATLRSFPDGVRNCYTLGPVQSGLKYRVGAEFLYGNYDGLRRPPTFNLYLGVNFWQTIETGEFNRAEIITVADTDSVQVCFVNTGIGKPFVSEIDLRPLPFSMYNQVNDSSSAIVFYQTRKNYGGKSVIWFPDDIYDRVWVPKSLGKSINTTQTVSTLGGDRFPAPQVVLRTASEASSRSESLEISTPGSANQATFVYMYFAELQQLGSNETREFSIFGDNVMLYSSYRPEYLQEGLLFTRFPGKPGGMTYSIRATVNSTLPPIINGVEIFTLITMPFMPTNRSDVQAILELKKLFNGSREWEGDPCVPRNLIWKGLGCGYGEANYSRIISLDLSRGGLSGRIPQSIANLISLTSLDLSFNNFTGEIPAFLGELPVLKFLNLEGNNLSGTVPKTILDRSKNGSLELRISNNPIICGTVDLCSTPTPDKKKPIVPIAIGISAGVLVLVAIFVTLFVLRRKKIAGNQANHQGELNGSQNHGTSTPQWASAGRGLRSESNQFSEADIRNITSNFKRPIGKGGFGTVYYGTLEDGTEVAVKQLSRSSVQGERQFRAEAELLTRVHHKYLVSLLGYCKESMALVYEYVKLGSLADHLSGDFANSSILSWSTRIRIALEAAQGLDYLHHGCKPTIVHRDVKPSNFLLTENFEVKIADFGLSRSFDVGRSSYAPTGVAGTPGYLDPESQQTGRFSQTSDVYSFGVVLLELVTGKPPFSRGINVTHITKEVWDKVERGDLAEIADPRMQGNYDVNSMWQVIDIALSCASFNSSERPSIGDVAAQLKKCLAAETSREFHSGMSSGTFPLNTDYSVANASPAAR